jgi:outer membrane lipoprotein-sorting protein
VKTARIATVGVVVLASLAALAGSVQKVPAAPGSKDALAVLEKLIGAMGGRKVLESIKDTTITGTVEIVQFGISVTAPFTICTKEPNMVRTDVTIDDPSVTYSQAYNGQKGWATNPQTGTTEEMPDYLMKEMARRAGQNQALLFPQKNGVTYALKPKSAIDGKDYIVLEQTLADGHTTTFFLDQETTLPFKVQTLSVDESGAEVDAEIYPANYQKVGGAMVAFSSRTLSNGSESRRTTFASVTFNKNLDDALFVLK